MKISALIASLFLTIPSFAYGADAAKADAGGAPYKASEEGKKVDENTYKGYSTYTSVCVSCHGRDATGGMGGGANLVEGMKKLSKENFKETVMNGRPGTLMAGFKTVPAVADNIDGLFGYLKGRSDGKIWGKSLEKCSKKNSATICGEAAKKPAWQAGFYRQRCRQFKREIG